MNLDAIPRIVAWLPQVDAFWASYASGDWKEGCRRGVMDKACLTDGGIVYTILDAVMMTLFWWKRKEKMIFFPHHLARAIEIFGCTMSSKYRCDVMSRTLNSHDSTLIKCVWNWMKPWITQQEMQAVGFAMPMTDNLDTLKWIEGEPTGWKNVCPKWFDFVETTWCFSGRSRDHLRFFAARVATSQCTSQILWEATRSEDVEFIAELKNLLGAYDTNESDFRWWGRANRLAQEGNTARLLCCEEAVGARNLARCSHCVYPLKHDILLKIICERGHIKTGLAWWRMRCNIPPDSPKAIPPLPGNKSAFLTASRHRQYHVIPWLLKNFRWEKIMRKTDPLETIKTCKDPILDEKLRSVPLH